MIKKLIKELFIVVRAVTNPVRAAKVVFYHDIGLKNTPMGTDEKTFIKHMKALGVDGRCRCRGDVVAFDDGFRGVWDYRDEVKSISVKCKVKVFVAPRLVGQEGYLTWDEIRTLNREYGVDFQCHTWSHQTLVGPMIDESPKEERNELWYKRELVESKSEIERQLNLGEGEGEDERRKKRVVVDELCFPVGNFSDDVIRRCKEAGYKKVYASYPGNITDDYIQPRCLVQDLGVMGFKAVLNGGMMVFEKRYKDLHYVKS